MNIAIDLVICAIVLIFAIISFKKGFISTLIELIGFFFSTYLSITVGKILSTWVFSNFLRDSVIEKLTENIMSSSNSEANGLSEFFVSAANALGIEVPAFLEFPSQTEFVNSICDKVVEPILTLIIQVVLILVLIPLFSLVFKLLSKLFKNLNKLPILGKLNEILGFVLGVGKGAVVITIIVWIIGATIKLNGGEFLIFNDELISQTKIFEFIQNYNPLI